MPSRSTFGSQRPVADCRVMALLGDWVKHVSVCCIGLWLERISTEAVSAKAAPKVAAKQRLPTVWMNR